MVFVHQGPGGGRQGLGFLTKETGGTDDRLDLDRAPCQRDGRGIFLNRTGGDLVDPFVGALRREDGRDQKLEGVAVSQGAVGAVVEPVQADRRRGTSVGMEKFYRFRPVDGTVKMTP